MKSLGAVIRYRIGFVIMVLMLYCVCGCSDRIQLPPPDRIAEFEAAGPQRPSVDMRRVVQARMPSGLYRVVPDDVLQLEMPLALYPDLAEGGTDGGRRTHTCRVSENGAVTLPDGRQITVAGKTLGEVEATVVETYYPLLVKTRPAVYAQVTEYRTARFQISGAVERPGMYELRRDQMSLVSLLMQAGGIVSDGSAVIRITRPAPSSGTVSESSNPPRSQKTHRRADGASAGRVADSAVLSRRVSIQFDPEGPLRTTGWLILEEGQRVRVRQWLDIANEHQRWAVLRKIASQVNHLPAAALNEKLWQLAGSLESDPTQDAMQLRVQGSHFGWQATQPGGFRASLAEHAAPQTVDGIQAFRPAETEAVHRDGDLVLALPVRGLNIPFADVPLQEGDSVVVERLQTQYITVVGLVRNPGNYPYPPDARYNLIQGLAFAGGLDPAAEPRFVSVYRLKANGDVASATFQLSDTDNQEELTRELALPLKPGDVVSVEHTPRTRKNVFLDRYFRLNMGMYLNPEELWGGE